MKIIFKAICSICLLLSLGIGTANASSILVIGADAKVTTQLDRLVPATLKTLTTKIRIDKSKGVITTDEGTEIRSDSLFASDIARSQAALKRLTAEYAPEFLLTGWVVNEKTEEYASYGLQLIEVTLQIRLIDVVRGKSVYDTTVRHGTEFAADEIDDVLRQKVIATALAKLDNQVLSSALESYLSSEQGILNRLRVVVSGLDQKDYFDLRDLILDAVTRVGVLEEARTSYSPELGEATVRIVTAKGVAEFYRGLYASFNAVQEIGGFEISREGSTVNLTLQPLARRIISIKTLSPKDYGSLGRYLVSIVSDAPGVSDVAQSYSEKDQTLVIEFVLNRNSLYSVDGVVWSVIAEDARFKDFAMGKIDQREIEYFFSGREGAANSDVIVTLADVSSEEYKNVATAFSDLISQIEGVRDLRYRYDYQKKAVIYRFKYEGEGIHSLDDAIVRGMLADEIFQNTGKGPERIGHLAYVFSRSVEDAEARLSRQQSQVTTGSAIEGADLASLDPSVVYIYSEGEKGASEGTGFFVSKSGHFLTNAHVIQGPSNYVATFDGKEYRANLIQVDENLDLALLQVVTNVDRFQPVTIGNSNAVQRGEPIIVIGNPSGNRFAYSVLSGIVSGTNREWGLLQLSVTTYGGVSGAPVFNKSGAVIGVMVAVPQNITDTTVTVGTESVGVTVLSEMNEFGFAIPINHAKALLQLTN